MQLTTKTALITGASSGIGIGLARAFAKDKFNVILAARSVEKMQVVASSLEAEFGIQAMVIPADLETSQGANELFKAIKLKGIQISALANNAGYGTFGEFHASALEAELAMMQLNMNTVVVLTKLFLPDLIAAKGQIINTASTAAFQPGPYMAVYYATKAFVLSFSEAIACELESKGVTVTALCPGPTASGFQDKADMQASALVKGKTLASADDVAQAGFKALKRGQRVFIPGFINWISAQSVRFLPRQFVTQMVKAMSKPS